VPDTLLRRTVETEVAQFRRKLSLSRLVAGCVRQEQRPAIGLRSGRGHASAPHRPGCLLARKLCAGCQFSIGISQQSCTASCCCETLAGRGGLAQPGPDLRQPVPGLGLQAQVTGSTRQVDRAHQRLDRLGALTHSDKGCPELGCGKSARHGVTALRSAGHGPPRSAHGLQEGARFALRGSQRSQVTRFPSPAARDRRRTQGVLQPVDPERGRYMICKQMQRPTQKRIARRSCGCGGCSGCGLTAL